MDNSTVKKFGLIPSAVISVFLIGMTFGSPKVEASPVQNPAQGTQLAWWVGVGPYGGWGYGGYGYRGWGYGGGGCRERCWRNRWGNIRCANNCWY